MGWKYDFVLDIRGDPLEDPFWKPVTSSSVHLKTTSCSFKLETEKSAVGLFYIIALRSGIVPL